MGEVYKRRKEKREEVVSVNPQPQAQPQPQAPKRPIRDMGTLGLDEDEYDIPTFIRRQTHPDVDQ